MNDFPALQKQGRRVDLPMQARFAPVAPSSIDLEARTVELVWSTGARVRRFDWWEGRYYEEELSLDAAAVDLSRLQNGAPLLNSHGMYALENQIGVVERAWLDKGEGRAVVRFSTRQDVEPIFQDVKAGIIRNVSVGYSVRKYEVVKEEGKLDVYRAIDWQPLEISMVTVPADQDASTRAQPSGAKSPCELVLRAAPPAGKLDLQRQAHRLLG